jgi:hypothetical protein
VDESAYPVTTVDHTNPRTGQPSDPPLSSVCVHMSHAFQKKSRRVIATPKDELDLIGARLSRAKEDYEAWLKSR